MAEQEGEALRNAAQRRSQEEHEHALLRTALLRVHSMRVIFRSQSPQEHGGDDGGIGIPAMMQSRSKVRVRLHIIRNERIEDVGKSQSCIVSKLRSICKQTVEEVEGDISMGQGSPLGQLRVRSRVLWDLTRLVRAVLLYRPIFLRLTS